MLRNVSDMENYDIQATDGHVGHVTDFYFDDKTWVIRYLVVDTGTWLSSRKVLISPIAIGQPNWVKKVLPVSITKLQVKDGPDIDTKKPVSRQHEMQYLGYYGYPFYWGSSSLWGGGAYPGMSFTELGTDARAEQARKAEAEQQHESEDPHLRSCVEVAGYKIQATDGDIGHVKGLLVDDESWAIRFIVVETGNWWLGHQVIVAPEWIEAVSWDNRAVSVNLARDTIRNSPPYDSTTDLDRDMETGIYSHYGRPGYRASDAKAESAMLNP